MSNKWEELNEIGRGDMRKRRSAQALAAWNRHAGAHDPGSHKPDQDDTEEQIEEYLNDEEEEGRDGSDGSSISSGHTEQEPSD